MSGRDRQASRGQARGGRDRTQRPPPQAQAAQQKKAAENRARQQQAAATSGADAKTMPSGMNLSEPVVKATAADGTRNLTVERHEASGEPLLHGRYYQFPVVVVTSLEGHRIEAEVQQGALNDTYSGTGRLETAIIPPAPHGMEGRLRARDLDTGEEVEISWTWIWFRGGLLEWLMKLAKLLFRRPQR